MYLAKINEYTRVAYFAGDFSASCFEGQGRRKRTCESGFFFFASTTDEVLGTANAFIFGCDLAVHFLGSSRQDRWVGRGVAASFRGGASSKHTHACFVLLNSKCNEAPVISRLVFWSVSDVLTAINRTFFLLSNPTRIQLHILFLERETAKCHW